MKINEPMRQFMIDRAQTLHYEARQFPQTRRVAVNWIRRALRLAGQARDADLYRSIAAAQTLLLRRRRSIAAAQTPRGLKDDAGPPLG